MKLAARFAAIALAVAPGMSRAADFYQGKTVTIFVGFTPGGGYDSYARLLSQFMPKYIPGKPSVIVQNMPGAGSLTAVRSIEATQPRDGTAMVIFNPGLVTQSVVQPDRAPIDFRKYAWIGVSTPDFRVCYGYGPKGVKSWDDLMKSKQWTIGGTGKGSGNYINGATLKYVFNAPIKQVLGYPGSADQRLAIEKGELDGDCGSYSSVPADWIRDKKINVFLRFEKTRPAEIPESATYIGDFAKTDAQTQLLDFLNAADDVGRPFIMSDQVPADRVAIMRHAFDQAMKDPDLLAQAQKQSLPIHPVSGQEATDVVAKMLSASPNIVEQAKKIYE